MANTVSVINLIQGPADIYTGAFGATEPADTTVNTSPPTSSWTGVGGTMGGVNIAINQTFAILNVDQLVDTPARRLTARDVQIKTTMAEATLANLTLAMNDVTAASGAGYSNIEPQFTNSAISPTYRALLLDGQAPGSATDSFNRRVIARKVVSIDNIGIDYAKDTQGGIPVTWGAHYVTSAIAPFHIVDQTS